MKITLNMSNGFPFILVPVSMEGVPLQISVPVTRRTQALLVTPLWWWPSSFLSLLYPLLLSLLFSSEDGC